MAATVTIDRRHIWFTTPLLIALAVLVGTFSGAAIQGYSNNLLERHKFEYVLIQQALSTPSRKDSAQNLNFLHEVGLLSGLNSSGIASVSKDDGEHLPVFLGAAIRDQVISVRQAKGVLKHLAFYSGDVDDRADLAYRIAVMRFQREKKLEIDGLIGPQTVLLL
jgi:hypothetical protein